MSKKSRVNQSSWNLPSRERLSWPLKQQRWGEFCSQLPGGPAVYSFEGERKQPIYIGKSIQLRSRIRQHVKKFEDVDSKQYDFLREARFLSYYPVKNDLTALILEARLIGINKPKFNSILRDGSSRLYIKISEDSFPLVKIARGKDVDDDELCFGPFMSHKQTKRVLRTARRIFKFCQNPGEASSSGRPCFYYQIDLCDGACVGKISGKEYRRKIGYIKRFLRGETKTLIKNLDRRIRVAAKNEQFAKAGKLKGLRNAVYKASEVKHGLSAFLTAKPEREKQLRNLSELLAGQGLVANLDRIEGFDISTWQQKQTVGGMVVFVMGMESKKDYRMFKIRSRQEGDVAGMEEMLRRRFAHSDWPTTGLILVDGGKPQVSAALKVVPEKVVVLGLAKKDERLVFMKDDQLVELQLDENWPAQALLMEIRDEAHRFANNYQKKVRGVIVDK